MSVGERGFDVRLATDDDVDGVLAALSDGYGRPFTREWFDWKHRGSPWGPSRCFIAEDDGGLLGAAFKMPWRFTEAGVSVTGWRIVDGATTQRAQRRGVFRAVVAEMIADCARSPVKGLALATATPEARLAHIKNGAAALEPIHAYYRPARWSRAAVVNGDAMLKSWLAPRTRAVTTAWDVAALRWRLDPRSGAQYAVSHLANGSAPHGAVHRTLDGKLKTLVVVATWGAKSDVARLLRAVAWEAKAVAVLANAGEGSTMQKSRLAVPRGQSLMCVWDQRSTRDSGSGGRAGWALDGLDLEGVI